MEISEIVVSGYLGGQDLMGSVLYVAVRKFAKT